MKNKKILKSIIIILILIEGVSLYLLYRPNNNEKLLEDIKTKEIINNKDNTLAIKVQDDKYQWSDQGTSTDWPDSNHYYYGTSCVDETGTDLGNTKQIVEFDDQTNTATVTTKKTIYCTIYFAYKKDTLALMQQTTDETYLKTVAAADDGELLRYVGTTTDVSDKKLNNYICFGTSNIDTCKGDKDTYMYRIIGIQMKDNDTLGLKQNQLKIIKATPPSDGKSVKWSKDYTTSYCDSSGSENGKCKWDYSEGDAISIPTAQYYLNNKFLPTITGTTGGKNWSDLISNPKWYVGDITGSKSSPPKAESKDVSSNEHKVGLMYASDYYNSWTYSSSGNTNSWLHTSNGITGSTSATEWTMTRYGYLDGSHYTAWLVTAGGALDSGYLNGGRAVRPVFYLTSNLFLSGDGTEDSQFIITVSK